MAYPRKTKVVAKTWRETISGFFPRFRKPSKSAENVKELELKPLSSHEMRKYCLEIYLDGYKEMLICGNFPQPFNICKLVDDIHHVYSSLYNVIFQRSDKVVKKKEEGALPEVSF